MRRYLIAIPLIISGSLMACTEENLTANQVEEHQAMSYADPQTPKPLQESQQDMISVTGKVVYKNLEGGFYGFDAENGQKYMPHGLDKKYLKHGMVLKLKGKIDHDVRTFQQYGEVLQVKSVEVLDDSGVESGRGAGGVSH